MRPALAAVALLAVAGAAWRWRGQIIPQAAADEVPQDTDAGLSLANITEELSMDQPTPSESNRAAFLLMIRHAEGTADAEGYRALFGHTANRPRLFDGWADHPRIATQFTDQAGRKLWTTAAGAYQAMAVSPLPTGRRTSVDTWDRMRRKLGLPDFSPESQDRFALGLIDEAGALADVDAGRIAQAVGKVRRIWASLPGAGYAQGERTLAWLTDRYTDAGGALA